VSRSLALDPPSAPNLFLDPFPLPSEISRRQPLQYFYNKQISLLLILAYNSSCNISLDDSAKYHHTFILTMYTCTLAILLINSYNTW
jgi:hypothetical protein